jgi:hypothetical protein
VGDFSVKTDGEWASIEKNALRYRGGFVIDEPVKEIGLSHIEKQGFPFFCGELCLEGEIEINGENPVLVFDRQGINALKLEVDDKEYTMITGRELSLKEHNGTKTVKLTFINNLRNLMGPHHLKEGECYWVAPASFFKEPCVWNGGDAVEWDDGYCFTEFGLRGE